uniref:Frizzled-4 n=1 Tax=Steinernema glaseri TaxID=37863 RepID=A0A1I8AQR7_9BILA
MRSVNLRTLSSTGRSQATKRSLVVGYCPPCDQFVYTASSKTHYSRDPRAPLILILLASLSAGMTWRIFALLVLSLLATHAHSKKICEPITIALCKGIGYNMTSYPNFQGHDRQTEAGLEVHQFFPLVEVKCYAHLKFFLCSLYTPICQDNYDEMVLPCREVCQEAKSRCEPLMRANNFLWPESLDCDRLPKMSDQATTGTVCAAPPDTPTPAIDTSVPSNNDHYPSVSIDAIDSPKQCDCRCKHPFLKAIGMDMKIGNVSDCAYSCHATMKDKETQQSVNSWIGFWSISCLLFSALTVLTFLIEMDRFQYPERPIFFLALCQMMVAIGFLLRYLSGHEAVACDGLLIRGGDQGSNLCMLVFMLTYYFGMASWVWWVVLSLAWMLAAASKWSNEAIANLSPYFHLFAWGLPALKTSLVILFDAVDGDPFSGICYVGNTNTEYLNMFVIGPLLVYFIVGVLFLFIGFLNLWKIRSLMRKQRGSNNTEKLTQLMSKIGIFTVLYMVVAVFVLVVLFYEQQYRPLWEQSKMCSCAASNDHAPFESKITTSFAFIKTAAMLVVGWMTSGIWILSKKTAHSWQRFFCCGQVHAAGTQINYQEAVGTLPHLPYHQNECNTPLMFQTTLRHCPPLHSGQLYPEKV